MIYLRTEVDEMPTDCEDCILNDKCEFGERIYDTINGKNQLVRPDDCPLIESAGPVCLVCEEEILVQHISFSRGKVVVDCHKCGGRMSFPLKYGKKKRNKKYNNIGMG